jgi:hypothetical protein
MERGLNCCYLKLHEVRRVRMYRFVIDSIDNIGRKCGRSFSLCGPLGIRTVSDGYSPGHPVKTLVSSLWTPVDILKVTGRLPYDKCPIRYLACF